MDRDEILRVLRAFEASGLEYVLIGATAMGFHGLVRATEDLDLFIRATAENVERLRAALWASYADDPHIEEISAADLLGEYPAVRYYPPSGDLYFDILTRLGLYFLSPARQFRTYILLVEHLATIATEVRLRHDLGAEIRTQGSSRFRHLISFTPLEKMAEKNPFARFLSHFPAGKVLFREGDAGEDMYIIQSGRVAIKKRTGANKDVTLAVLEKGDFFGEMAVLERMPRSATAEMAEGGDLIVISGDTFGDMIKSNPEIAFRMLRKYSIRLREMVKQIETLGKQVAESPAGGGVTHTSLALPSVPIPVAPPSEALAYFVSKASGNVFPVHKSEVLLGRFDSVTGTAPDVDLTNEDQARNISRRHARLVIKNGDFFIAEEIGTMNGTFVAGEKLDNNVLHPIKDGDELMLCRLALTFKGPQK